MTRRLGPWAGTVGGGGAELFDVVLATLAAGVGLALLPGWLLAGVAGLVHTGRWPHLQPVDTLAGLAGWAGHLADPRAGYPGSLRTALPGPVGMYGAAAVTLLILAGAMAAGWLLVRRLGLPTFRVGRSGAGFATAVDVRTALSATAVRRRAAQTRPSLAGRRADPRQLGLFLGRDIRSGQALYGSVEDSYLYLGPPRSGKGVHLIIPQALDAPGPVLVTATRPDTLRHTLAVRAASGPVAVFDPQGLAGPVPRLRWAPQGGCADPLTAIGRARALAAGASLAAGTVTGGEFWQAMTEAVLRCYLHAAALESLPMTEVLGWAARPTDPAPVGSCAGTPAPPRAGPRSWPPRPGPTPASATRSGPGCAGPPTRWPTPGCWPPARRRRRRRSTRPVSWPPGGACTCWAARGCSSPSPRWSPPWSRT